MPAYLGLDFGTSTTMLAKSRGVSDTEILPIGRATPWLPSVLGYEDAQYAPIIGEEAEYLPAAQVRRSIKRAITHREDEAEFRLPSGVLRRPADEVATLVIREALRRSGWDSLKGTIAGVRAGCPAMWDAQQRARLRRIMADAGLAVDPCDLIDEPIAAAVSWVNHRRLAFADRVEGRILVFDYGGGTLDIALCEVAWEEDLPEITVLSCLGIAVAGDVLDDHLAKYAVAQLKDRPGFTGTETQLAAIHREVRLAKESLSFVQSVDLELAAHGLGSLTLSRAELEREFRPQLAKALKSVTAALRAARLREKGHPSIQELLRLDERDLDSGVDYVLPVGGMSRIPLVEEELQRRFAARVERVSDFSARGIAGPQHLVAAGLIHDPGTYDRLNLHQPGFNLRVEWLEEGGWEGETVYEAHTPLYSADTWCSNSRPGIRSEVSIPTTAQGSEARLMVTSESGQVLPLRLDQRSIEGLTFRALPGHRVAIKLYVDGRILILVNEHERRFDGASVRIERWQVIRGPGARERRVELVTHRMADRHMFDHPHK